MKKSNKNILTFVKGMLMGMVDMVPGISGGTMALILGIYTKIIGEISKFNFNFFKLLLNFKIKQAFKEIDLKFLSILFSGIAVAIISLASIIHYLIINQSSYIYSLFFGLILASIIIILPKQFYLKKAYLLLIIGFIIAWLISSFNPLNGSNSYLAILISGAITICAMILPGISGSLILILLGKYEFMISVLKNPFFENNLLYLLSFISGAVLGLLLFVKLLNYLLKNYKDATMAILIGFMAGSLKKVYTLANIQVFNFNINSLMIILLIIAGIILAILLNNLGKNINKKNTQNIK